MTDENPPVPRDDEIRSVVSTPWTPEDASRFISSAIQEAQRPLADALRQRSVTPALFILVVAIILGCSVGVIWFLVDRLEKSDTALEKSGQAVATAQRDQESERKKSEASYVRAATLEAQMEMLDREHTREKERINIEITAARQNEDELKKLRGDSLRYRRQLELLKSQITGLEMEKAAISRQLSAAQAMLDDSEFHPGTETTVTGDTQAPSVSEPATTTPDNAASQAAPPPANPTPAPSPSDTNTVQPAGNAEQPKTVAEEQKPEIVDAPHTEQTTGTNDGEPAAAPASDHNSEPTPEPNSGDHPSASPKEEQLAY